MHTITIMTGETPEWEAVLAAAARLQTLVPDAVLVGGTAAAHHARHRVSFDDDHVVAELRTRSTRSSPRWRRPMAGSRRA